LVLAVSVARVRRRMTPAVVAMAAQAALALGLVTPLLHRFGVTGAGVAWLASQCAAAAGVLALRARDRRRRARPPASVAPAGAAEEPRETGAVSVVVATRDRPGPLRECLDSVLSGDRAPN